MRHLGRMVSVLFFLAFLMMPTAARADNVVISSGSLTIGGAFPPGRGTFRSIGFAFAGDTFSASGGDPDGATQVVNSNCVFSACPGGATITLNSNVQLQQNLPGSAFIAGVGAFPNSAFFFGSAFEFRGADLLIPSSDAPIITITAPFELTGVLTVQGNNPSNQVFSTLVNGSGIATLTLQQYMNGYVLTTIRYDFQPVAVPEPATLLLFGGGLAGALAARKRPPGTKA
jgi:hypothetical protein